MFKMNFVFRVEMEAVSSSETSIKKHGVPFQKDVIFVIIQIQDPPGEKVPCRPPVRSLYPLQTWLH
jgi:hypothetical protein